MAVVVFSCALFLFGQQPVPVDPEPINPPGQVHPFQTVLAPQEHSGRRLRGEVNLETPDKRMTIYWAYDDVGGGRVLNRLQTLELAYWPTAAEQVKGALLVSGVRSTNGHTVIERWTLEYPPVPAHEADYGVIVTSTETLYDARVVGMDVVRLMQRVHGAAGPKGQVLLQFQDSNDLYYFDIDNPGYTLLYSPVQVPGLDNDSLRSIWSGDHPEQGYVYVWQVETCVRYSEILVMLDGDRNGTLDQWHQLDEDQWEALLGPPIDWVTVFQP